MDMTNAATKKQYSSTNVLNTIGNIFRPWLFCPIATPGRQGITETQKHPRFSVSVAFIV
jgi:hypothetical protein